MSVRAPLLAPCLVLSLAAACTVNRPRVLTEDDAAVAPTSDAAIDPTLDAWASNADDVFVPGADALVPREDAYVPPLPGTRSVFFSGHSLININTPSYFAQLSERDGRASRYQLQMGVGSPMSVRLACPRSGQQADGNGIAYDLMTELRRPGAYDTLILTERHDIVTTILYESTTSMARRYRDAFREGSPAGRAFLFESWFTIDRRNPSAFRARQERELVAWQCVASKVNETRGDFAPMLVVPAGQAVSELVGDVLAGRAPGMTSLSSVFLDDVHLTPEANYLIALIHFGVVHQRSPEGLPHTGLEALSGPPLRLSAETAAYLQSLAARIVERTFSEAALSQRSDAECASLLIPPCTALMSAGLCSDIVRAFRDDTAPVPMHSGEWCLR
ncbi:MAG: hypothetical protein OHK0013_17030 [Sandaracinaceae bacterium]